jgi:hypothetical protein
LLEGISLEKLQLKLVESKIFESGCVSPDTKLMIEKLKLELPNQPPPRLVAQKENNEIEVQTFR